MANKYWGKPLELKASCYYTSQVLTLMLTLSCLGALKTAHINILIDSSINIDIDTNIILTV